MPEVKSIWASIGAPPPPPPPPLWFHGGFWVPSPPWLCGSWSVVHGLGFRGLGLGFRVQDFHSGPLVHCGFRV